MADYLDILKDWERGTANPAIYEHLDMLFPGYGFRRLQAGSDKDRWASALKLDMSQPKTPNREKTVVYASDFKFREQGDWDNGINVIDKYLDDNCLGSIYDAYKEIASRLCLDMPTSDSLKAADPSSRNRKAKLLEELQKYFEWNLVNNNGAAGKAAREYLEMRGFSKEWASKLHFGLVPSWEKVEAYITSGRIGYSREELEDACKVRSEEGYTTVGKKHVLAIPYRCAGSLKGFLFRAIDSDVQPKYKANTGLERKSVFFNMPEERSKKEIIIVEGEMDALTATAAGIQNVVAIGGSDLSGDRRNQIFDALNRNTAKITLCLDLDADAEGKPNGIKRFMAVRKSLHAIFDVSPDFNEVYVACFPEVTDPDEFIRKHGPEAFQKVISKAVPWWEYISRNLSSK
jgi:DNA primase (bacterial type)